jgi:shikimate dehydrogenase
MHNAAFLERGINAIYTAFEVKDLKNAVRGIKALGIEGVSVTIPYKVDVIKYIDRMTDIAAMIGSVNTLILKDGLITGDNTDAQGFYRAITGCIDTGGKKIALFGAGGAGRAIIFSLFYYSEPSRVFMLDLDKDRTRLLEENIKESFPERPGIERLIETIDKKDWSSIKDSLDIIINATPAGMEPDINSSVLEESQIPEGCVLMDIVYHPHDTLLTRYAAKRDCKIVYGEEMLLYQGVLQFELWTGQKAPVEVMKKALKERIYGI